MSEVITSATELVRFGKGSAFLDERTGDLYRLRDWGTDWMAEPFTGEKTVPNFSVQLAAGMNSVREDLPYPVRVVWAVVRRDY